MYKLLIKYQLRTGAVFSVFAYILLFLPPIFLLDKFKILTWTLLAISILQIYIFNPLKLFPENILILRNADADIGNFLKKNNILLVSWSNIAHVFGLITFFLIYKIDIINLVSIFLLFNSLLFATLFLGNKFYISSLRKQRISTIGGFAKVLFFQFYIFALTTIILVLKFISKTEIIVPLITVLAFITVWFMHIRSVKSFSNLLQK